VIDKLVKSIKRNRLGVAKKKGAMCNYMFIGATGTGKTFLAKKLAAELYGSEDNLLRYDMSEYSDEISVNKLIGAPPGYVGYTEGGMLIKDLESHPQCVILFDEVEKAHPAIYNLLLQLLDEGHITDNAQHKASVKDCVIILTSNVGVKSALDYKSVGYSSEDAKKKQNDIAQKSIIENQLHKRFAPEFLNRLDGVCYFENLGDNEYNKIYDREISLASSEIAELGYTLKVDKKVRPLIVDEAKKENLGARALLRVIQQKLFDVATSLIVDNEGEERLIKANVGKDGELVVKLNSKQHD
jgi:ATP-dependent Clp protease ATP-binding subunit ClpC